MTTRTPPPEDPPRPAAVPPATARRSAGPPLATIRELLSVESLRLRLVAGSAGADRPVRWAHAIELLDPRAYLRGGELVLTMGSALLDEASCRAFVAAVLERDASGIGFGRGNFHETAPEGLVRACEEAGLALVEVPFDVPFIAITEELAERMASRRAERDRRRLRREANLLDLLTAGRGVGALAAVLARELRVTVAVADADGTLEVVEDEVAEAARSPQRRAAVQALVATIIERLHPGDRRGSAEIDGLRADAVALRSVSGILGWLVAARPAGESRPELGEALREAAPIVSIELATRVAERTRERRTVGRLLGMVRNGVADAVVLADRLGGASLDERSLVASVWRLRDAEVLRRSLATMLVAEDEERLYVVAGDAAPLESAAGRAGVPAGIGSLVSLRDLGRSVLEAEAAFSIAVARGSVATWRDLASLPTLLGQQPPERLAAFAQQLIVPVVEYDARHAGELLTTLRAYLREEGVVDATARSLRIHPNSLRHRLRRLALLTGRDPAVFLDRAALYVGLWAWDNQHRSNAPR